MTKFVIAAAAFLGGVSAADPQAGSAGGYALKFQGINDLAGLKTSFATATAGTFPTAASGLTTMMWFKPHWSKSGSGRMTLHGEVSGFDMTAMLLSGEGLNTVDGDGVSSNADKDIKFGNFYNTNQEQTEFLEPFSHYEDSWHHFALTARTGGDETGDNTVAMYIDGVKVINSTAYENAVGFDTMAGFVFGSYADLSGTANNFVANDHFHGYIDEIGAYGKALSAAEVDAAYQAKLDPSDPDLLWYFDFEDAYGATESANLAGGANKAEMNLLLGASHLGNSIVAPSTSSGDSDVCRLTDGGDLVFCAGATAPAVVGSGVPISGTGNDVFAAAVINGAAVTINLPGVDADDPSVTYSAGTLTSAVASAASEGTVTVASDGVATFTPPAASVATSATFTYTVTSGASTSTAATVRVVYASAPVANDVAISLVEDVESLVILNPYDPVGLDTEVKITKLPDQGTLYALDASNNVGAALVAGDLPKNVGRAIRFKFIPENDNTDTQTITYTATNTAGVTSSPGTVTIGVYKNNDLSTSSDQTATLAAVGQGENVNIASVDPDSSFVSVQIKTLPVQGELFYVGGDSTNVVSPFDAFFTPSAYEQYVNNVLEASTFWPDGNKKWHPDQTIGEPDAANAWGDSTLAIAFYSRNGGDKLCGYSMTTGPAVTGADDGVDIGFGNFDHFDPVNGVTRLLDGDDCWDADASHAAHGYSEFFTVQFENQVYIKNIELGENRGMGSVVSIEAWDYGTSSWMVIWEGPIDEDLEAFYKETLQYRVNVPYPLCQPSFKSDIVRIKVDTKGIDDWNEFDYVKLTGSDSAIPGLLPGNAVFYQPPNNLDCIDTFTFSTTDCNGLATRQGEVSTFSVKPNGYTGSTVCSPKGATATLKIGMLFPMYSLDGTEHVYSSSGHNNMVGALMAIEEINADLELLPNTELTYEVYDTKHDPGAIILDTFYLAKDSFNGKGADVVVGGAYSGPTIASHNVLKSFGTPQMSYSATSPLLSDTKEYPYFLRTVPSDAFQGKAIAQFLKDDLEYTNVCVVHGDDAYNANLAAAFIYSSLELGITVVKTIETNVKPTNKQAADYIAVLKQAACRVVFLSLHSGSSPPVFREAKKAGIFGAESGWMFVVPDTITTGIADVISGATEEATFCPSSIEEGEDCPVEEITSPGVAAEDFAGMMGCLPLSPSGDALAKFMEGYEALPSTVGTCGGTDKELTDDCQCASGTDAVGNKLYQRDHDNDPDTPDRCIGFVTDSTAEGYFEPEGYTYYAYDVIYAFANAAHDMIVGGATSFEKAAMMAALKDVAFDSVTGRVDFETSGDREIGAGFTIKNYKPTGWEAIGNWDKGTGMVFNAGSLDAIVYPTADNSKPVNKVLPLCQPEDIAVTVGACTSDSKRAASFNIKVDDDGDYVCQDGVDVPADVSVNCEYSPADSTAGFLAYILGLVGFGIGMAWAVWVGINMNNKVIKVAQPIFCMVFAVAAGLVSLSNIFFVGENSTIMCILRPFVFNVMFDLMFGSLFMKTFRVYKIFGNKSLSKVKVSSFDVVKTYGGVLSIDVALLIIWMVTEGMEQVEVDNSVQGYWEYQTLECNKAELWEFATTFFKILMVLAGVYLSYITRNVPDKFAESKWIALSIYQVFILGVVGLLVKSSSPDSILLVQGIAVPAASIVSTCCIFGPKLLMIRNPGDYDDALKTSANTSGGSNTSNGDNNLKDELDDANNKIANLEREIEELKDAAGAKE